MLKLEVRPQPSKAMSVASPLIALVVTVLIGVVLFLLLGKDPLRGLQVFFWEPIKNAYALSELAVKAVPLVLIALGLAVCFRSNVWNIGAEGQFILGALAGGWVAMQVLRDFDVDRPVRAPIAYALGLVLFVLSMVALWRRPALSDPEKSNRERARNMTLVVSVLFATLWLLWVFGAMKAFWLVAVVATLPAAVSVVKRSVDHILSPPDAPEASGPPSVLAAAIERGTRALLIIGAIWLLAWGWGIDLDTLAATDTVTSPGPAGTTPNV